MTRRIYVTEIETDSEYYIPGENEPERRAGFFNPEKALTWDARTEWDGNNSVDVNTGIYFRHQMLYRTAQGRWVLHEWSRWEGEGETYTYRDEDSAREWLLFNSHDDAVEKYFGKPEEERAPGRPEIGNMVSLRLGDALALLDDYAHKHNLNRGGAARKLINETLG